MAITVTKTNNEVLVVVQDGVNDTDATSLNLLGRNYIGYSTPIADNFVHLLENFANDTEPLSPITGQLWYDTLTGVLKIFEEGIGWKTLSFSAASATAPTNPVVGDSWFDSNNQQLKVWTGSEWLVIGPTTPSGFGFTGSQVETILDSVASPHTIGKEFVDGNLVAIISQDAEFTPGNASILSQFGNLRPGYNLSNNLPSKIWNGTSSNTERLGNIASTGFLRANVPALTTSSITVQNDTGITIGQGLDYTINVNDIHVSMRNNSTNGNISLITGNTTALVVNGNSFALTVSSAYGNALVSNGNAFTSFAVATKGYVDGAIGGGTAVLFRDGSRTITGNITPDTSLARDFGSSSLRFATIWTGNVNVNSAISTATGTFLSTTNSTSTSTGAVVISGGLGVGSNVHIGGNLVVGNRSLLNGNVTSQSILPTTTNTYDIGASGNVYRSIYANAFVGIASSAQYADLAEIYESDLLYDFGTVVSFGGNKEITISSRYADTKVAGVISKNPGYLLNSKGPGLPVALRGKVTCKITGKVSKGDMLVTSELMGVACASEQYIGGAIIGKSLEDADFGNNVGTVLIAIGSI